MLQEASPNQNPQSQLKTHLPNTPLLSVPKSPNPPPLSLMAVPSISKVILFSLFYVFFFKTVIYENRILLHFFWETGDFDEQEKVLSQFDMNMAYGPCLGITRLARLERAQRLGLNPPKEIENLLKGGKVKLECLFDGRV